MPDRPSRDPVRFLDVLTTAATVASFLGRETVGPAEMIDSLAIVLGEKSEEDLGQPVSPMISLRSRQASVDPAVQALVQRWFVALGGGHDAALDGTHIDVFRRELANLVPSSQP